LTAIVDVLKGIEIRLFSLFTILSISNHNVLSLLGRVHCHY